MEIKGIEVSGEVYDISDESARTVAETNQTNIGTLDDLTTEEKSNLVEAVNEVKESVDGIESPTSMFDFLELLQGNPNNASPLIANNDSEADYTFSVSNATKYKGYAFVVGDCIYQVSSPTGRKQGRQLKFVLKDSSGDTNFFQVQFQGGDRQVQTYQLATITASGVGVVHPAFNPKADSDSESDTSQGLFGVYAIYGIL